MRWLGFLAILVVAVSQADSQSHYNIKDFFEQAVEEVTQFFSKHVPEEAPYTIIKSTNQYEERSYPARKWICTEQNAPVEEDVMRVHFRRFKGYLKGNNSESEKISMALPVTTQITPAASGDLVLQRLCFYLGHEHQANPPTPNDTSMFIEERPAMHIFTRTVGGWMDGNKNKRWLAEEDTVKGFLDSMEENYNNDTMWWVGYDAPWVLWNRRNEVWIKNN